MNLKVNIYNDFKNELIHQYVVIAAITSEGWIWVRHKERSTWEMPGGHIEPNETIIDAAKRELYEETGTLTCELTALFDYSVETDIAKSAGRVFIAQKIGLGKIPESEIEEIRFSRNLPYNLTYPLIQPELFEKAVNLATEKGLI